MWEEAIILGENPRVKEDDHHTFSHTTTVDLGDRTRIAAVISDKIVPMLLEHQRNMQEY